MTIEDAFVPQGISKDPDHERNFAKKYPRIYKRLLAKKKPSDAPAKRKRGRPKKQKQEDIAKAYDEAETETSKQPPETPPEQITKTPEQITKTPETPKQPPEQITKAPEPAIVPLMPKAGGFFF